MTLYKQLVSWMVAIFLLLMIAVFIAEFRSTQNYLERQQLFEVHQSINSAGLALAPYLEDQDKVAIESVVNALFDGSYYKSIKVTLFNINNEIVKIYPNNSADVPMWFMDLDLFDNISETKVITSGWLQLAEIKIITNSGHIYEELWDMLVNLIAIFAIITGIGIIIIAVVVKRALSPLQLIVNKMKDVADNNFNYELPQPKTQDLKAVIDGINAMSSQIALSFKLQALEAEELRDKAYFDAISGLGNRTYFIRQLDNWLSGTSSGGVALLKVDFIERAYEKDGYEAGDALVRELSELLKATLPLSDSIFARLKSSEFGFIFPNFDEEDLKQTGNSIIASVQNINGDPTATAPIHAELGMVLNSSKKSSTELLSLVDNALTEAYATPDKPFSLIVDAGDDNEYQFMGKQQWKQLVDEAIHSELFSFTFQSAIKPADEVFHQEVFSKIEKEGRSYSANQYLFALQQLGETVKFDQYIITSIVNKIKSKEITTPIAINIATESIINPTFVRWLSSFLKRKKAISSLLHFEIKENAFIENEDHTALLCRVIKDLGAQFGVDDYGRNFESLNYIKSFKPKYVKLDYMLTDQIDNENKRVILTSISRAARSIGIVTIASRVENKEQLALLAENNIDVFQGFFISDEAEARS